jgi:hypothetical protein
MILWAASECRRGEHRCVPRPMQDWQEWTESGFGVITLCEEILTLWYDVNQGSAGVFSS